MSFIFFSLRPWGGWSLVSIWSLGFLCGFVVFGLGSRERFANLLGLPMAQSNPPPSSQRAVLPATSPSPPAWLRPASHLQQIETHFRGLDLSMLEIGHRYREIIVALNSRSWDLALYHTEKIELSLRLALERRPKRRASAQGFLHGTLPFFLQTLRKRQEASLPSALQALHHSCLQCHNAEKVPHFNPVVERLRAILPKTPE